MTETDIKAMDVLDSISNNIPVIMALQYGVNYLQFPILPEKIKIKRNSASNTATIENTGEIGIPTKASLATISINSFFWQDRDFVPTSTYINWLLAWQRSKKPAKFIVTKLNYSMYVTCESFDYETRAGEEKDVYFSLELQEYRPYGAKIAGTVVAGKTLMETINGVLTNPFPIVIPIFRPARVMSVKFISNPYTTVQKDTLISISKKLTGTSSNWHKLYELNKEIIGNNLANNGEIPSGTKLKLPKEWASNTDSILNANQVIGGLLYV